MTSTPESTRGSPGSNAAAEAGNGVKAVAGSGAEAGPEIGPAPAVFLFRTINQP